MMLFNVLSSMLNVVREEGLKNQIEGNYKDRQVMIIYGSGHSRSFHQYFLSLSCD